MREKLKRLSILGIVSAALLCGCGQAESGGDVDVAQGGTGGASESQEAGASAATGGKLPADFCPEVRPMGATTCGLNFNHPDAVCVYGAEICRCSSPDLVHQPPLWGCQAAPEG